jgi:hypothetical protein
MYMCVLHLCAHVYLHINTCHKFGLERTTVTSEIQWDSKPHTI